jgi:DNA-directed RNA polymerase subunit RPC12/RpoP
MSNKKDELKAKLLAEAEAVLEQMLSDERMSEQMTITEIEAVIGEMEKDFRQRVLREVMGKQEEQGVRCPECGGKLRNKGKHGKRLVTLRGETDLDRSYYQCQDCGKGIFPPG